MRSIFFIFVIFKGISTFACDESLLKNCLMNGGGFGCYKRYYCSEDHLAQIYCDFFDYDVCVKYEGGETCKKRLKKCNYVKEMQYNDVLGFENKVAPSPTNTNCDDNKVSRKSKCQEGAMPICLSLDKVKKRNKLMIDYFRKYAKKSEGNCWGGVWRAMMDAYQKVHKINIDDDKNYSDRSKIIPPDHAYELIEWSKKQGQELRDRLGYEVSKGISSKSAPVGSLLLYDRGKCGYSGESGHIEMKTDSLHACSDFCHVIRTCEPSMILTPIVN